MGAKQHWPSTNKRSNRIWSLIYIWKKNENSCYQCTMLESNVKDISSPQLDMRSIVKSPTPIRSQDKDKT
jgi:hypothetical protein